MDIPSAICKCHSDVDISTWSKGKWSEENTRCSAMLSSILETHWPFRPEDEVVLVVAKANKIRHCTTCREGFIQKFRMPRLWWGDTYKRMNGYFGSESTQTVDGVIESHSTWSRALIKQFDALPGPEADPGIYYRWLKFNLFTRWTAPGKMIILVFDPVQVVQERLRLVLSQHLSSEEHLDPYWLYAPLLEEIVSLQGTAVWGLRDLIRRTELSPTRDPRNLREKPRHNYSRLHDIARHAIHVSETLDLSVKLTENIIQGHDQLTVPSSHVEPGSSIQQLQSIEHTRCNIRSRLTFFSHALYSLRCRSTSNQQRLGNEIQLRFHTDSQYDSQVSVEINHSTKTDSASMRWIAIVSLIFLPANLVSSIFSTTFFDVTDGAVSVTKDFWIYWVVLVAVTAVTMAFWFYLPRLSFRGLDPRVTNSIMSHSTKASLEDLTRRLKGESANLDQVTSI